MPNQMGVAGKAIVCRDGTILMIRRSSASTHDPGLWELPGGKMDLGERLTDALVREVAEETTLTVEVGQPFLTWHFAKEPFWVTGVTFVASCSHGDVVLSDEHDEYGWFSIEDALALPLSQAMREQVEAYAAMGTPSSDD